MPFFPNNPQGQYPNPYAEGDEDRGEIYTHQEQDDKTEAEIEDLLTEAMVALREEVNDYTLAFAIRSLEKSKGLLLKYTADINIVPWTIEKLEEKGGDEVDLFDKARNKILVKLAEIGFKKKRGHKVPWEEKITHRLQIDKSMTPERLAALEKGAKKNLT